MTLKSMILTAFMLLLPAIACKPKSGNKSLTAQEQCQASQNYTWQDGACRLNADIEKEQVEVNCKARGADFIWINEECVQKDSVQSPREACESQENGAYWRIDPKTNEGACIGPSQALTARDECLKKVVEGYVWQDERCLSPDAQKCIAGGDFWTNDDKCITPSEKGCIDRNDGSKWSENRCVLVDELNCRKRGYHFSWDNSQEYCKAKTFIDYCEDKNIPEADLKYTMNLMLTLPGVPADDCYEAAKVLNTITSISLKDRKIKNLAPLAKLTNIEKLDLQGNDIVDVGPLEGLNKLTYLNLASNQITNIAPLGKLPALKELSLTENQIVDLLPIAGMKYLEILYLKKNQIATIDPLVNEPNVEAGGLKRLKTLNLSENCGLSNIAGLLRLESLEDLTVQNVGLESANIPAFPAKVDIYHSKCP